MRWTSIAASGIRTPAADRTLWELTAEPMDDQWLSVERLAGVMT
jgi:hypothetical protein